MRNRRSPTFHYKLLHIELKGSSFYGWREDNWEDFEDILELKYKLNNLKFGKNLSFAISIFFQIIRNHLLFSDEII